MSTKRLESVSGSVPAEQLFHRLDPSKRQTMTAWQQAALDADMRHADEMIDKLEGIERNASVGAADEWLTPTTLSDMANRLDNISIKKAKSILRPHGLKSAGNRQLWTVRLSDMPRNMREALTR